MQGIDTDNTAAGSYKDKLLESRTKLSGLIKRFPDVFLGLSLIAIIANDLCKKFFSITYFDSTEALTKLAAPLIILIIYHFFKTIRSIHDDIRPLKCLVSSTAEVLPGEGSIPHSDLISRCKHIDIITLSGSVMIPFDEQKVKDELKKSRKGSRVRCLIANPFSNAIIGRYANDEPEHRENRVTEIEHRLVWLFNISESINSKGNGILEVKVYNSYPVISLFKADCAIYSSYYGYKLRGHDTPCILTDESSYLGKSLVKHFNKLYSDSTSLQEWISSHYENLTYKNRLHFSQNYSGTFLRSTDGTYIFQRRDAKPRVENPGMLSIFGGRSNKGESSEDTAIRELREETELIVLKKDLVLLATFPRVVKNSSNLPVVILCKYYLVDGIKTDTIRVKEGAKEIHTRQSALSQPDLTEDPRRLLEGDFGLN